MQAGQGSGDADFERVHDLAPEEPQSWRDLALALGREARSNAVDLLYEVAAAGTAAFRMWA